MTDLEWLLSSFPEEGLYHQGALFRVKHDEGNRYALSISVSGPCGDKTPHPVLTFDYHNRQLAYRYFADFVVSPVKTCYANDENLPFFQEAMTDLLAQFLAVFPKQEL